MAETWRLIDTGLGSPARNIALNRALLEARHADEIPGTLRFARFTPCALLAFQQSAEQELDLDFCRGHAIPVQRRVTGGPATYVDERHLVWELYVHRREVGTADLRSMAKRICHAAATALSALGIDARYRARSDVEVDGRTLATGGMSVDGDAILFQGTLPIDGDVAHAFSTLRTPWSASDSAAEAEARKRAVSLRDALGRHVDVARVKHNLAEGFESEFDVEFRDGDLGLSEQARCDAAIRQIDSADWVGHIARPKTDAPLLEGRHQAAAGLLRAVLKYERQTQTIKQVWFAGEAAADPRRLFCDLEAALRDIPAERVAQRLEWFFASRPADACGFVTGDFASVLLQAAPRPKFAARSGR
jgi:lipoate-protein ligase A